MFSRSSQNTSSSQTPLTTVLNTPIRKIEFALLIFVSIDRMRKELVSNFEASAHGSSTTSYSNPVSSVSTDSSSRASSDAPPPYTPPDPGPAPSLIDLDEPISPDADPYIVSRPTPSRQATSSSGQSLRPYQEWDQRQSRQRLERALAAPDMQGLRRAALTFFDAWRMNVLRRTGITLNVLGDTVRREKARRELQGYYAVGASGVKDRHAIPTKLLSINAEQRALLIQSALLLLLGLENYPAHSRVLLLLLTRSLDLPLTVLTEHEISTAKILLASTNETAALAAPQSYPPEQKSSGGLNWKVGLATVGGAALIGITGGLAAPLIAAGLGAVAGPIMGAFGLGGLASLLGALIGNTVLVGTLFGVYGGKKMAATVEKLSKDVEDFDLMLLNNAATQILPEKLPEPTIKDAKPQSSLELSEVEERLRVTICVSGSLNKLSDVSEPWEVLAPSSTLYALKYESEALMNLGEKISSVINDAAFSAASYLVLKHTVLKTLMAGLYLPLGILKAASIAENPFAVAMARSEKAGVVLAKVLIAKAQGERPVNLIGFGLGARVIWDCCQELARQNAFGLLGDVVLMGLPGPAVSADKRETEADLQWRRMRTVVSGRIVNCYSSRDWILKVLFRVWVGLGGVAGLTRVEGHGVENEDVSDLVGAHAGYATATGSILQRVEFEVNDQAVTLQFERARESREKDDINAQRRDSDARLAGFVDDHGRVEMVDGKEGKIVMVDLDSGEVNEKAESAKIDLPHGFDTLTLSDGEMATHPLSMSAEAERKADAEAQAPPSAEAKPQVITHTQPESKQAPFALVPAQYTEEDDEEELDDKAELVMIAPEAEPEPEEISFGEPGSEITMTWDASQQSQR